MLHDFFKLSDRKGAELYVEVAEIIMKREKEVDVVKRFDEKIDLAFVMYLLGWWSGVVTCSRYDVSSEIRFLGKVFKKIKSEGKEEAVRLVLRKIKSMRERRDIV